MLPQLQQVLQLLLLLLLLSFALSTAARFHDNSSSTTSSSFNNGPLIINDSMTIRDIAHKLLDHYDSHHRPMNSNSTKTEVEVNLHVQNFGSISVMNMDYTIDILLRQRWRDERLQFRAAPAAAAAGVKLPEKISLSYMKEKLWIPDLFFRNSKLGFLHETTTPNHLIWLTQDGVITFSQKLTVKLACPMQLWNFPMDTQHCPLEIGSYGYGLSDLSFTWSSQVPAVTLNSQMTLNEFNTPPQVSTGECSKSYKATGAFSCLFVEFKLQRQFGFYLIYTYLPSVLLVTIAWISFWIDCKAVPARITLGLLTVLALLTQTAGIVQQLPRVSYVKAIDVWLFTCLAFVVSSLLEFALVNLVARRREQRLLRDQLRQMMGKEIQLFGGNFLRRRSQQRRGEQPRLGDNLPNSTGDCPDSDEGEADAAAAAAAAAKAMTGGGRLGERQCGKGEAAAIAADNLDFLFAMVYPACFIIFNFIYWPIYYGFHTNVSS